MGKVYKDLTVEIPSITGITISHKKPYAVMYVLQINYDATLRYAKQDRTIIGYATDNKHMHPNDNFRKLFPKSWEEATNEKGKPIVKHMGLYAAVKLICQRDDIQSILDQTFGKETGADLLDFAMHSIINHTSAAESFSSLMRERLLFSNTLRNDDYFSRLFKSMERSKIFEFRKLWAEHCALKSERKVWLCIDGSNDDCHSKGVVIAEKGHAKSHLNVNIVSFTYAVTTTGLPVTFELYRGGLVDAKAMRTIIDFLKQTGFDLAGVILDRGYCSAKCIQFLRDEQIPYKIMVKGNCTGVSNIIKEFGEVIKMNAKYLVEGTSLFAAQKKTQLFADLKGDDFITLFYDYKNAGERIDDFLNKMYREMERIRQELSNGKEHVAIASRFSSVLKIIEEEGKTDVIILTEELQKIIDDKGLYEIVCSEPFTPSEINKMYVSRKSSETQYMILKTQLGYGVVRVELTSSVYAKFMLAFLSSIIRFKLEEVAKKTGKQTTSIIRELDLIEMYNLNGVYTHVHNETSTQLNIFETLGKDHTYLDAIAKDENKRLKGVEPKITYRKTGVKKEETETLDKTEGQNAGTLGQQRKKPGPKPGFKHTDTNKDGSRRAKPGPKAGSHMGKYKKDGTLRQKPGPKSGSHHDKSTKIN